MRHTLIIDASGKARRKSLREIGAEAFRITKEIIVGKRPGKVYF